MLQALDSYVTLDLEAFVILHSHLESLLECPHGVVDVPDPATGGTSCRWVFCNVNSSKIKKCASSVTYSVLKKKKKDMAVLARAFTRVNNHTAGCSWGSNFPYQFFVMQENQIVAYMVWIASGPAKLKTALCLKTDSDVRFYSKFGLHQFTAWCKKESAVHDKYFCILSSCSHPLMLTPTLIRLVTPSLPYGGDRHNTISIIRNT